MLGEYWLADSLGVMPIMRHVDLRQLAARLHVWHGDLFLD
jgi:hypothetical protein